MIKIFNFLLLLTLTSAITLAQDFRINFEEYDLKNGLHVILHKDTSAPIVEVNVTYHVGSKNEQADKTGFAHFFEHLMFEGTKHIKRREFAEIIKNNGGVSNAFTTQDITFYTTTLSSNHLELSLWMEAERMLHPKIDSAGIENERKIIKEEKKLRMSNQPYGYLWEDFYKLAFPNHSYRWMPIGDEQYIDQAKYADFELFFKTYYVPENAVLTIVGDINIAQTKQWIQKYFSDIPNGGKLIPRPEKPNIENKGEKRASKRAKMAAYPALIVAFQTPEIKSEDIYALKMINILLFYGESSRMYYNIIEKQGLALQVSQVDIFNEQAGIYGGLLMITKTTNIEVAEKAMIDIFEKLKSTPPDKEEFAKIMAIVEKSFYSRNTSVTDLAEQLANNYLLLNNTALINTEIEEYRKITPQHLSEIAKKYFTKNNRIVFHYIP